LRGEGGKHTVWEKIGRLQVQRGAREWDKISISHLIMRGWRGW